MAKDEKGRPILQSRDVLVEFETGGSELRPRGITTGETQIGDLDFIERYGLPAEWAVFRQSIEARRRKVGEKSDWQSIPGLGKIPANKVLGLCAKCGRGNWHDADYAAGGDCLYCNPMHLVHGGKLRVATKKETAAWMKKRQENLDKWLADAPKRAAEVAVANLARRAIIEE